MAQYKLTTNKAEDFEKLAKIAFNLRHFSRIWKEHFGATNRNAMVLWESKMDEFLAKNVEIIPEEEPEDEIVEKWEYENPLKKAKNNTDKAFTLPDTK